MFKKSNLLTLKRENFLFLSLILLAVTGCASTTSGPAVLTDVSYQDPSEIETYDTRFSHSDLQMVAERMTMSLLMHEAFNRPGKVIIAFSHIENNSDDRSVDTVAIAKKIRVALIKSGKALVTSFSTEKRDQHIRDEVMNQQKLRQSGKVNKNTIGKKNNIYAADYFLTGEVSSIRKRAQGNEHVYMKFTMEMVDPETGLTIWAEEKEITKTGKRATVGW